jgi:hypothetical protein
MAKYVKVEGEAVVKDGTGKAIEFYEAEFLLDDSVATLGQARSIIQNGLIRDKLQRQVQNFANWRTCQVVEFREEKDSQADLSDMDKLLIEATELNCIPENIDSYKRPDYKMKALQKAIEVAKARPQKEDAFKDLGKVD